MQFSPRLLSQVPLPQLGGGPPSPPPSPTPPSGTPPSAGMMADDSVRSSLLPHAATRTPKTKRTIQARETREPAFFTAESYLKTNRRARRSLRRLETGDDGGRAAKAPRGFVDEPPQLLAPWRLS